MSHYAIDQEIHGDGAQPCLLPYSMAKYSELTQKRFALLVKLMLTDLYWMWPHCLPGRS